MKPKLLALRTVFSVIGMAAPLGGPTGAAAKRACNGSGLNRVTHRHLDERDHARQPAQQGSEAARGSLRR